MQSAGPHTIEVTATSFDVDVLERSHEVPVLVDFWAPWCGPCRMLAPALEELAASYDGKFILAKANTEDHPAIGQRYDVRSIPAVKLFVGGKVVGEFVGALPGSQIKRFLDTHLPSESDALVADARTLLASGDRTAARDKLRQATEQDNHPGAHLVLAKMALADGDVDIVQHHVDAIDPGADEIDEAKAVLAATAFWTECNAAGGEAALRAKLQRAPDDLDAGFALGCCLATQERYADALAQLLEVVKRNNKHRSRGAHKAMVTIFDLVGRRTDLVDEYSRQLQIYT